MAVRVARAGVLSGRLEMRTGGEKMNEVLKK
jgi:hypothetical protein